MKADDGELIGDGGEPEATMAPAPQAAPVAAASKGIDAGAKESISLFVRTNSIEAYLLLSVQGQALESALPAGVDPVAQAQLASAVFANTEKAAQRMRFGALKQVIIAAEDGRQILFVQLKSGVLAAVTGKNTNLGMLRIAINDLVKKA